MSNKKGKIPIVASLEGHSGPVKSVVFHPTAHLMATAGGDHNVKLWDIDSHRCLATLVGHEALVSCVAFHPTAPVLISGSEDFTLKVWNTTTHQCLSSISLTRIRHSEYSKPHGVTCIAIHPTMSFIVTGEYYDAPKLWTLSDDKTKLDFVDYIAGGLVSDIVSTRCVAVHPTEPLFATGRNISYDDEDISNDDSAVLLWSYKETEQGGVTTLAKEIGSETEKHTENVVAIALHPTKPFMVTGSNDNTIRLWGFNFTQDGRVGHTECMATLYDHGKVTGLAFHPTAPVLVSCSADESVVVWILSDDMRRAGIIGRLFGNRGPVTSIAFHSNGRLLATGNQDNCAILWDCSVLSSKKQRTMALMRGAEQSLVPKTFSRYMTTGRNIAQNTYYAELIHNTLKKRGPNFLGQLEDSVRRAQVRRAQQQRSRMVTRPTPMITAGPSPKSHSSSRSSSRSSSPSKSPSKSPSPEKDKGGGGASITKHRRRNRSSRKVKRRTRRYRK